MLIYKFNGYDDFKEIFGLRELDNGVKARRNSILLSFFKTRKIVKMMQTGKSPALASIRNMTQLKHWCLFQIEDEAQSYDGPGMWLNGHRWYSNLYKTDRLQGKTLDGDSRCIRYVRRDTGKVYKMKAGKMYRHLILNTELGRSLPESVVNWLCEELVQEWAGYNTLDEYALHVDNNFEDIYNSDCLVGSFGSCMVGEGQYGFYEASVNAKAAYLTDADGDIVSRAIIFMDCRDESGRTWRLCERQYSSESDETLKQILVNLLIKGGYIDGYKRVGADCRSPQSFVDNNGNDLSEKRFEIACDLDFDDILSYQDSFKWYNIDTHTAYNHEFCEYTHRLDTTSSHIEDDRNWDEYHEQHTNSRVVMVYYHGRAMDCAIDELDDFVNVRGEYHHQDDVHYCEQCDRYYIEDDEVYSEYTECCYCCEECRMEAEREWCEDDPHHYFIDGEVVCASKVTFFGHCGEPMHIANDAITSSVIPGTLFCCSGCKNRAEKEFYENSINDGTMERCAECLDICRTDDMHKTPDGRLLCCSCATWGSVVENLYTEAF